MNRFLKVIISVFLALSIMIGIVRPQKVEAAAAAAAILTAGAFALIAVQVCQDISSGKAEDVSGAINNDLNNVKDWFTREQNGFVSGWEYYINDMVPNYWEQGNQVLSTYTDNFNAYIGSYFADYDAGAAEEQIKSALIASNNAIKGHIVDCDLTNNRLSTPFSAYQDIINDGIKEIVNSEYPDATIASTFSNGWYGRSIVWTPPGQTVHFASLIERFGALDCYKNVLPEKIYNITFNSNKSVSQMDIDYYTVLYYNPLNNNLKIDKGVRSVGFDTSYILINNQIYAYFNFIVYMQSYACQNKIDCTFNGSNICDYTGDYPTITYKSSTVVSDLGSQSLSGILPYQLINCNFYNCYGSGAIDYNGYVYFVKFDDKAKALNMINNYNTITATDDTSAIINQPESINIGTTDLEKAVGYTGQLAGADKAEDINPTITYIPTSTTAADGTVTKGVSVSVDKTLVQDIPYSKTIDDLDLDIDTPAVITDKFPFSLPFDVYHLFNIFSAEPHAPHFVVPLTSEKYGISQNIDIDMSQYDWIAEIVRWLIYIIFLVGLALKTNQLIGRG